MLKKIFSGMLALLFVVVALVSCNNDGIFEASSQNTSSSSDGKTDISELLILNDGKSEYSLVVDFNDNEAKRAAQAISEILYSVSGIVFKVQDCTSVISDKEIIVGDCRDTVNEFKKEIEEDDFIIAVSGYDLIFYATGRAMYDKMLSEFKDIVAEQKGNKELKLDANMSLIYSRDIYDGSSIALIDNRTSDFVFVVDYGNRRLKELVSDMVIEINNKYKVLFKVRDANGGSYEKEIIFDEARALDTNLSNKLESNDFMIAVNEGNLVLYATSISMYDYLKEVFYNEFLSKISNGVLNIDADDNFIYSKSKISELSYAKYYQQIYNTYGTRAEDIIANTLNDSDRTDQALVEALIDRMSGGVAVYPSSSSALYNGYIVKLDTVDYSKVTLYENGDIFIAEEFARKYFGSSIAVDSRGYFNLTDYCKNSNQYTAYRDVKTGICVVMPVSGKEFFPSVETGIYTDAQFLVRMKAFFENKHLPEPDNNTEQSRVVVGAVEQDAENSFDWKQAEYQSIHDPSMTKYYDSNNNLILYSSYYYLDWENGSSGGKSTILFESRDSGKTWKSVASDAQMRVATLFTKDDYIYLVGQSGGNLRISRYNIKTGVLTSTQTNKKVGGGGPGSVLITEDRIYKCGNLCVVSASIYADLMNADSWVMSNPVEELFNEEYKNELGVLQTGFTGSSVEWEEASVVKGKDGNIYVVYRQNKTVGYANIYKLSKDGTTLSYTNECNGTTLVKKSLIVIPSSITRHLIRYDESTGLYISLMNVNTVMKDPDTSYTYATTQRNGLYLVASEDLVNWRVVGSVLVDRQMINTVLSGAIHGFQYADFEIIGDDIYFVVRETVGETINNFHEAPEMTFYILKDYKSMIAKGA